MRIAVVSCVFPPEPIVSSRTSAEVAEALASRGHSVRVITGYPSRPAGQLFDGFARALIQHERSGAYELTRTFSTVSRRSTIASRLAENLIFGITSAIALAGMDHPDVIYANTWPLGAQGLLALVAAARGVPLVLSVQDVYPESLIAQGRTGRESRSVRLLRAIDGAIARSAATLVVISRHFAELYASTRGVARERTRIVPNWGNAPPLDPDAGALMRERWDIATDERVAVYGGNIGTAAGVEHMLASLAGAPRESLPRIVIAGAGAQLAACRAAARAAGLDVIFHTPWAAAETAAVLSAADVLLLPTIGDQASASVPSKLISYLLSGRPVIAQVPPSSETAAVLQASGGGWTVATDDPGAWRRVLSAAKAAPADELAAMGSRGRAYAEAHLTRDVCLPALLDAIEAAGRDARRRVA